MTMDKKPEVLAPAGDFERLRAAVAFGADAVYLGGKSLGMRAACGNFDGEELRRAVAYAHGQGVRVYFTCNTVPLNREAEALEELLRQVGDAGVDAVIAADIGVMMTARRLLPDVELHISTQAGVANYLTATELARLGASRVVLARELPMEEIKILRDKTPPELAIECFVHGAMCVSFSGRCLLSHYIAGRDANRGECAQPCRWGYHLMEEKRPGEYYPLYEDERGSYILNAKDLCMIGHLDQLAAAGVDSFKIEGRAKSAYYTAVITNAYRNAVDLLAEDPSRYDPPAWLLDEVKKVSHREYSTGFYFGRPDQCYRDGGYVRDWEVSAVVEGWEDGLLLCTQRNRFCEGDVLEALIPRGGCVPVPIVGLLDGDGAPIAAAPHPMMALRIPFARALPPGTILRRKTGA